MYSKYNDWNFCVNAAQKSCKVLFFGGGGFVLFCFVVVVVVVFLYLLSFRVSNKCNSTPKKVRVFI